MMKTSLIRAVMVNFDQFCVSKLGAQTRESMAKIALENSSSPLAHRSHRNSLRCDAPRAEGRVRLIVFP